MSIVNKIFVIFIALIFSVSTNMWAQNSSQRLKNEQQSLEQKIANTKALLAKSKESTKVSLEEVHLIEKEVEYRELLLRNIDNQIRSSELKVKQKEGRIAELNAEIDQLKTQYQKLLMYAYKKRNKYGDLMYIFSAKSVEEALKRKLYLEKLTEIQKKQMRLIQQNKVLLQDEIKELNEEKKKQLVLADQKKVERAEILKTKQEKERVYQELKKQEDELLRELRQQEENRERLKQEIAAAIQKEIAEEQARLEKLRREAEAKRKAEEAAARKKAEEARKKAEEARKKGEKSVPEGPIATVEEPKKPTTPKPDFSLTAEASLIGENFVSNKGKLPWPVAKGTITQNYGKNQHPTLPNVFLQNNGIDISTDLNANVLAVFKGEVTTVINIPGAGQVVIVKHGNFRTVYSNLQEVFVTKGTIVETKAPIGRLLPGPTGNISIAHFEVHETKGNNVTQLNPTLWIAR